MKKKIAILGSTGSIGKSTIDILRKDKKNFDIILLTTNNNYKEILKQIEKTVNEGYKVVFWPDDIKEKDINDMILAGITKEEIQTIIKNNTYQGSMAKIRMTTWRKTNA